MTDPERLSQRSTGLAAELLRAGVEERPNEFGVQQTLLALGLSGVTFGAAGAAGAATASAKLSGVISAGAAATSAATASGGGATAGSLGTLSATLIVKWIGIGALGGVGLMGVAAVATPSPAPPGVARHTSAAAELERATAAPAPHEPPAALVDSPAAPEVTASAVPITPPRTGVIATHAEPELDVGIPLSAEVAYVDRARALLSAGQASQGLSLLERYEQQFPEARLLPEVLFLRLEAYERSGRGAEARRAAQRLLAGFANSPHAARARKLLDQ